jgi:FixJ family two-component response regulator
VDDGDAIVLVVDDDPSMREQLRSLIRSVGLECETFASGDAFLDYRHPERPSCVVLDVLLPDASGLDLPSRLERGGVQIPIIFITGHGTIPMSVRAMKAGAVEFLTKPFSAAELLGAIAQALERDRAARAARAEEQALRALFATLTPRERDVFVGVAAGRLNKQIAADLGTAEQTVKQHRGRVMEKLGLHSVADLVRFAERLAPPA